MIRDKKNKGHLFLMELKIILQAILKNSGSISKTKLLKLAYLAEYYYYKKHQTRLTNTEWIFFLYGPYVTDYEETIKKRPFKIEIIDGELGKFNIVKLNENSALLNGVTDLDLKLFIKNIVSNFGHKSLEEILDFIYFDTEPILSIRGRKEKLDFSTIQPNEPKIRQKLDKRKIKQILNKYKIKVDNGCRI